MTIVNDVRKFIGSIDLSRLTRKKEKQYKIVFFGAGAIGGSVAAWLAPHHEHLYVLDREPIVGAMRRNGITTYRGDKPDIKEHTAVKVIDDLAEAPDADVVVIAVKNYSLDAVAKLVRDKLGDRPIILAMQNGVANQEILPQYFTKVVYCVVSYNAWMDEPVVIGYQKKGPLVIGTMFNEMMDEMADLAAIFNQGVETVITDRYHDAAHCKLVINLTNSLTTLIGHKYRPLSDEGLFQKILTNLTYEGMTIIKAAGYRESRLGGMPSWATFKMAVTLPPAMTKPLFDKNVKKMVLSSMAQDILQRGAGQSELEDINGYLLSLADRHGIKAPYNRAVYYIARREFDKPKFEPMDIKDLWAEMSEWL